MKTNQIYSIRTLTQSAREPALSSPPRLPNMMHKHFDSHSDPFLIISISVIL